MNIANPGMRARKYVLTLFVLCGGLALGFNACSMGDAYKSASGSLSSSGLISISPSTVNVTPGQKVTFQTSGGSGSGYTYNLYGGSGTLTAAGVYTAPSTYESDTVQVLDANGNEAYASVIVGATSTLGSATGLVITPNNFTIQIGHSATLVASGGSGAYTFKMYSGLGSVTAAGIYTSSASTGNDYVMTTDSAGNLAYSAVNVTN